MKQKHKLAELLIAIANGEEIQRLQDDGTWRSADLNVLAVFPHDTFRVKPDAIIINGVECVRPVSPDDGRSVIKISFDQVSTYYFFDTVKNARTARDAMLKPFTDAKVECDVFAL
jgi:hypothetical protein